MDHDWLGIQVELSLQASYTFFEFFEAEEGRDEQKIFFFFFFNFLPRIYIVHVKEKQNYNEYC